MDGYNIEREYGDLDSMQETFSWGDIFEQADWDAPDRVNIAHEICDRWAEDRGKVALYAVRENGERETITFWELAQRSNQFANVLEDLGVEQGDRVYAYLPRIPEHLVAFLGTLKAGAVFGGINERFGPEGISYRLEDCDARTVITTSDNRDVIEQSVADVSSVEDVIVVSTDGTGLRRGDVSYHAAMADADTSYGTVETAGDDDSLLYYTSGTTGQPKGVVYQHEWFAGPAQAWRYFADVREDDLHWFTGDLSWASGPISVVGSWFWGTSIFLYEGPFDAHEWVDLLDEYPISVLVSVPTAYRTMKAEVDFSDVDLDLRHAMAFSEPLGPEVVDWAEEVLGVTLLEAYGSTETGSLVVANNPTLPVRPGSMGKPSPGYHLDIVEPGGGDPVEQGETGEIAIDVNEVYPPALFARYWDDPGRTEEAFVDGQFLTGDLVHEDEDGYYWFEGRSDDIIISAGYRIGPAEVENSLEENASVVEAAAVPKPDETRGNIVKAFAILAKDIEPTEALKEELQNHVRNELSAHEYPREIEFVEDLPRTVTGKIRRNDLRDRAEAEVEGEREAGE